MQEHENSQHRCAHAAPYTHTTRIFPCPCTFQLQFLREQRKDAPMWMKCLLLRWCVIIQMEVFFLPISTHHLLIAGWFFFCFTEEQAQRTCEISQSNNPHYVVAYIRDYRPGRGCYSNSSSRSHQHVHVISLKLRDHGSGKSRRNVVLKIEPKNFQDLQDSSKLCVDKEYKKMLGKEIKVSWGWSLSLI